MNLNRFRLVRVGFELGEKTYRELEPGWLSRHRFSTGSNLRSKQTAQIEGTPLKRPGLRIAGEQAAHKARFG